MTKEVKLLWNKGDNTFIQYVYENSKLNKQERDVARLVLCENLTQEQASEELDISTRGLKYIWKSACEKILAVPGTKPYINSLR